MTFNIVTQLKDEKDIPPRKAKMTEHRHDLPPNMPSRIRNLRVDSRGYPVPWFVEWIDGVPDFRIVDGRRALEAAQKDVCWVCGQPNYPQRRAFAIGPMCAVNRTSAEPPGHPDCMIWSVQACPFLSRPKAQRRSAGLPEGWTEPAGLMIERNPGVSLVWVTNRYALRHDGRGGVLFHIVGSPIKLHWIAEGREATRAEILESIDTGLPLLRDIAEQEGDEAIAELHKLHGKAMALVPP